MKIALWVLLIVCVLAITTQAQKSKQRCVSEPIAYLNGEQFLELAEPDWTMYATGLMDGFYAATLFGASDQTMESFKVCTKEMDNQQIDAIFTNYVKDHPEYWQIPMSIDAYKAMTRACHGGLKVVDPKK